MNLEELEIKIKHLNELDLKGDLVDKDYEDLKNLKLELNRLKEKERQKSLPKQVIVIRKDLNMPAGKLAAQVAHASMATITNRLKNIDNGYILETNDINLKEWLENRFTKVILYVKSEKALLEVYDKAIEKQLPTYLIEDAGFTVFDKPTKTCLSIGPCLQDDLIGITNKLQLFKD